MDEDSFRASKRAGLRGSVGRLGNAKGRMRLDECETGWLSDRACRKRGDQGFQVEEMKHRLSSYRNAIGYGKTRPSYKKGHRTVGYNR
jgi:hypothetical protein